MKAIENMSSRQPCKIGYMHRLRQGIEMCSVRDNIVLCSRGKTNDTQLCVHVAVVRQLSGQMDNTEELSCRNLLVFCMKALIYCFGQGY